jgi:multidrug efflux system membrane fusion protein
VSAGQIELRDINVIQQAIGTITASNTVVVRPRIDGELKAVHFNEGQSVRAGQLLAEMDARAFEVQLAQAEGQLARDQAQLANARNDLARYQDLVARDAIARQQLDTQAALVKQLSGSIRVAEAAVENARLMLSYTRITAPISGQAGLRLADPGNVVRAGDNTGLVVITQTQPISVVFSIPESVLPPVRARLAKQDRPRVEAWDRELRARLAAGEVVSIDNAIDVATGTIRIKAQFENRDGALFPNQFVNIRLYLNTLTQTLAAPATALQRGAAGTFVYLIDAEGLVSPRPVRPGVRDGDWIAIQAQVKPGDRVVTDGADRLRPGARVEVIVPRARPGGPPPGASGARPGQTSSPNGRPPQ